MKTIYLSLAILLLAGCSTIGSAGAGLNDEALATSEFVLCKGVSVGSWLRAYGSSADKAQAWRTLCGSTVQQSPK